METSDTTLDFGGSELERTLRVLSSPAKQQLAYLRGLGPAPVGNDEMAIEFGDDLFPRLPTLVDAGRITLSQFGAAALVEMALTVLTRRKDASLWTDEAIETASEWEHIRKLAHRALAELGKV